MARFVQSNLTRAAREPMFFVVASKSVSIESAIEMARTACAILKIPLLALHKILCARGRCAPVSMARLH